MQNGEPTKTALTKLLETAEKGDARQWVYLITFSRVLDDDRSAYKDLSQTERKDIAEAVLEAFANPMATSSGGRPREENPDGRGPVCLIVVFQELHQDGAVHYHAVVKLNTQMRFAAAKRTLREKYQLPSHFSCSHSLLWSALRYGYIATPAKPDVDETPWIWTPTWTGPAHEQQEVDLFELSQRPFRADDWRKRKQGKDKEILKEGGRTTFNKLDLTALIVSKHLYSKDCLLTHMQEYGTVAMQLFASKHQRKLQEYIEDAEEWATAPMNAAFEKTSDWELLCQAYRKPCPHGDACSYKQAVAEIFQRNIATVSQRALANALRSILKNGPAKHIRIPFLVGPSNCGKSTLLYAFDDLFGPKFVMHKPALGSTFGLRNIAKKKRFIFWDDYSPVEYASAKTVPKSTFLSLFIGQSSEIQVSQSFSDGNIDVKWNRGVVFTAKADGLWTPAPGVSEEDVIHIRNRCDEFHFNHVFQKGSLKEVTPCAHHLAEWILKGSADFDAMGPAIIRHPGAYSAAPSNETENVEGFVKLMETARIPGPMQAALAQELQELGAVDVGELTADDWQGLVSWAALRPLQQRRILQHVVGPQRV